MTEEEKKEFEEFLQWKKEKAERENSMNMPVVLPEDSETKEEIPKEVESDDVVKPQVTSSEPESEYSSSNNGIVVVFGVVMAFIITLIFIGTCSNKSTTPQSPEDGVENNEFMEDLDTLATSSDDVAGASKTTWDFSISKDDMTDTKNIWAKIVSDNYVSQEFPYEGFTYASITVRYMKKYGYDVLIEITKGQINGSEYNGTDYITARFDDGTPKKYYFNEAADGSSEVVFLRNTSDFISRCKKAKDIKIDLPLYKGGRPVFTFHVDEPLVWRTE